MIVCLGVRYDFRAWKHDNLGIPNVALDRVENKVFPFLLDDPYVGCRKHISDGPIVYRVGVEAGDEPKQQPVDLPAYIGKGANRIPSQSGIAYEHCVAYE